jgi:valyl-tRNA synthetase
VPARVAGVEDSDLSTQVGAVTSLAWLTAPGPEFRSSVSLEVRLGPNMNRTVVVELDTSGTIDVAAERRRLEKDLAAAQKELASTAAKLANADFLAKAPQDVVGKIRDRQRVAQEESDRINARLAGLQ